MGTFFLMFGVNTLILGSLQSFRTFFCDGPIKKDSMPKKKRKNRKNFKAPRLINMDQNMYPHCQPKELNLG